MILMLIVKEVCKAFKWSLFKSLNNMIFLRISYFILVGVPVIAALRNTSLGNFIGELPLTLKLGYLSMLLLSLAHMVYQGYCPQIIKRFESPNDLYRDMLEIKSLQFRYLQHDKEFDFNIKHCREGFDKKNLTNCFGRIICFLFYLSGLLLAIIEQANMTRREREDEVYEDRTLCKGIKRKTGTGKNN